MDSIPNSGIFKAIMNVQEAAQADIIDTGQAHVELLEAIRQLNLAAETPSETLMRMRFQVELVHHHLSCHLMSLFTRAPG